MPHTQQTECKFTTSCYDANTASNEKRMRMRSNNRPGRRSRGESIAELPGILILIFLGLFFPLLDLGAIAIGANHVYNAARGASERAGRANNFSQGQQLAKDYVATTAKSFGGLTIKSVDLALLEADKSTPNTWTLQNGPLPDAHDTANKVYQVQVTVNATVAPLLTVPFPGTVPGLNAPIPITTTGKNFVENVDGLND